MRGRSSRMPATKMPMETSTADHRKTGPAVTLGCVSRWVSEEEEGEIGRTELIGGCLQLDEGCETDEVCETRTVLN